MIVPLLVVYALGHIEWSLYAVFGAFPSIYARKAVSMARLRIQTGAAVVMVLSLLLGVLTAGLPHHEWVIIVVAAVWATVVASISDVLSWNPPGPLFAVFALCAVASVPVTGSSLVTALVVSVASAVFALLLGMASMLHPRTRAAATSTSPGTAARPSIRQHFHTPGSVRHVLRFGIAALIAGSLSTGFGIGHPYWAIIASIVPLVGVELSNSLVRGTHRVVGTFVGLGLAWLILLMEPSGLLAILIVAVLQILAELFVARNYAVALIFVTPLALVMIELAHPMGTSQLITDRAIETVLGTIVAVVVAIVTWAVWGRKRAL
ncbi:MAG: hypothetical protein JWQ43_2798 [Glaciihabitans sp.]|nr:hypothetical protein [Glaciihabitans sp.]